MALPEQFDLKDEVINYLKGEMPLSQNALPRVTNAYPNKPHLLPCISVTEAEGDLGPEAIGEDWNRSDEPFQDPETLEWYEIKGSYYRTSVEITIWAINATDRDALKKLLRHALWRLRPYLAGTKDFQESRLTNQGDSQDFRDNAPTDIYIHTFHLSGLGPLLDYVPLGPPAEGVEITAYFEVNVETEDTDDPDDPGP